MCAIFFLGCMWVTGEGGRAFTWLAASVASSFFCSALNSSVTMVKSAPGVPSSGLVIGFILILIGFGAILTTQQPSSSSSMSGSEIN